MKNKYFIWGNAISKKSDNMNYANNDPNIITVPEFSIYPIDNIFIKDYCSLYLTGGELYKEGYLNFEMNLGVTNSSKRTLLNFKWKSMKETISDVSIGESHVLVLTKQGNVFSWGDNYYGQLGLDKNMLPWALEPEQIKISNVKSIYAYKNNSFAIDNNNKLWVWGKKDLLGGKLIYHQYKPTQILKTFSIEKLKISDDRVIVEGKISEKEENNEEQETPKVEEKVIKNNTLQDENQDANTQNMLQFIIDSEANLKKFISKISEDDIRLVDIRKRIINGTNLSNLEDQIKELEKILIKSSDKSAKALSKENLSFHEVVDLISIFLKSIITGKFQANQIDNINKNLNSHEKDLNKIISEIDTNLQEKILADFNQSLQILSHYMLKYKKIEHLIYKMSFHLHLLKDFEFDNVLNALNFLYENTNMVEKKFYLLEKSFDSLNLLLEKTNSSFQNISATYSKLHKVNIIDETTTDADRFIYKFIIETSFYIRDLWKLLIENIREHRKAKEKEVAMEKVFDNYKELHSIQMYLNSISVQKVVDSIKKNNAPDSESDNNLNKNLEDIIKQTDGSIRRLEILLNKVMDYDSDHFTKVNYFKLNKSFYVFRN
jgi:hypothetical protein